MAFNTKLRFNCAKFWQNSADIIELSGSTSIGTAQYLESLTGVTALTIPTAEWVTGQTGAIDANNGLIRQGDYISLGGSLTGDTTINGAYTLTLNPLTFNATATNIGLTGTVCITGVMDTSNSLTVAGATHLGTTLGVTGATNLGNSLSVTNAISGNTTLDILGATILHNTLNVTNQTIIGGALTLCTHSAGSTSNPIMVLDGNVVKCVAASSFDVTAVNGITATGNEVELGGTTPLCKTTDICGAGFAMNLGNAGSRLGAFTIDAASAAVLSVGTIDICAGTGILTLDSTSSCILVKAIAKYDSNCASEYDLRSIPDVHYVTGLTSQAILTASNGLTKTGTNVKLGGALTEASGLFGDGYTFQLGTTTRRLDILGINASGSTTINVGTAGSGVNRSAIDLLNTGISLQAVNSSNVSNTIAVGQTNMVVTDAINSIGLEYAADYCSNGKLNPRWLPDNDYVTGLTSQAILTASNGLTKTGTNVTLGGTLTSNTVIDTAGYKICNHSTAYNTYNDLALTDTYANTYYNFYSAHETNNDYWNIYGDNTCINLRHGLDGTNFSEIDVSNTNIALKSCIAGTSKCVTLGANGLIYAGNYCSCFVAQSLVDKDYVDNASGGILANNGLNRQGCYISLGGTLTGDTVITGSSTLLVSAPHEACDVQYFKFNPTPSISGHESGRLYYENCALNFEREVSGVTLQIGEESVTRVTNVTAGQIDNGTVVYINGSNTGLPSIDKADASDFVKATQTIGVATHDILDNNEGYITTLGIVHGISTIGFNDGDLIWLSDTTPGVFTDVRPSYPSYSVSIGMVITGGLAQGDIYVKIVYVPNFTEYGLFTGYTATTNTTLNEKLDITDFDIYSGDTDTRITANEAVTALAITGVTNGICNYSTHNACLGGVLSAPVTLSGTQLLTMGDLNGICMSVANTTDIGINAKSNGAIYIKSQSGTVASSSDMTNAVGISIDFNATVPMLITDNKPTPRGLQYGDDYTSTYVDRSLVDKYYVDSIATGLNVHAAVVAATTVADGDIVLSGNSGTIDSINVTDIISSVNRMLIKNQTNAALNGIYSASTGDWGRTEDYDFAPSGEISNGDLIPVLTGVTNTNSQWINISANPIVSGDSINFSIFSQQQGIVEGNGICVTTIGSNKQIAVKLSPSNSGLCINSTALELDYTTFRYGLTCSVTTGKVDVRACVSTSVSSEILVRIDTGGTNVLYVDDNDFSTTLASNGLTKNGSYISLGGALTGNTTVCGNSGAYDLNFTELDSFNLGFDNTSTITDSAGTPRGLQYAGNYSGTFLDNSLVSKYFVNNAITGSTLTFNNGLTKQGDTISWGGSLTGDTVISHGAGRICMTDGGTSTVTILSDCSSIAIQNTSMLLRSCTSASCSGTITMTNTGTIAIATNNATTGITITDSGSGVGAVYADDYSSNFVGNSLINKKYSDDCDIATLSSANGYTDTCVSNCTITASNGLTKTGTNITLGGTLAGVAEICGAGQNLYLGTEASPLGLLYGYTCLGAKINNNVNGDKYFLLNNTSAKLHAEGTTSSSSLNVSQSDGILLTFSGTSNVMYYDAEYSSLFTARSIPDVAYVTGLTSAIESEVALGITGATNGLTKVGQEVKLGGTLSENTTIDTGTNTLCIISSGTSVQSSFCMNDIKHRLYQDGGTYYVYNETNGDVGYHVVSIDECGATPTNIYHEFYVDWNAGITLRGGTKASTGYTKMLINDGGGAKYHTDYSSRYTARSLVDAAYVTGQTGAISASNGLTRVDGNITLGGALTGNTTISGAHTLALSSLTAFNATATNIGLTGAVCVTGVMDTSSSLNVTGAIDGNSSLDILGATALRSTLDVTGATQIGGALTTTTTAQIGGNLTLSSVATGSIATDEVMLITSGGVVKKVAASTLGEDNNIYSKTTYTSSQTLTTGSSYVILVNHSVPVTITLPATPLDGQVFKIKDVSAGGALTNNITIGRNGKDMDRTAANALINTDSGALELVYDSTLGWFTLAFVN